MLITEFKFAINEKTIHSIAIFQNFAKFFINCNNIGMVSVERRLEC